MCTTHRRQVKDPAHNPRARAPEHLQLVNNLISSNHSEHADETHLPVDTPTWNKLATHMREIAVTPCRVCFQCGMVNHPQPGDTIRVSNVTSKYDCRAYRVFRYFIKRAIRKMRGRMPENADRADADKEVFLCEPHPNGGCKVFTCSMCKCACKRRDDEGKLFYSQCSAAELDLFDGHRADGTYESIGIGEKQAPEYAACSVWDRLALGVLKMANPVFKGYGGAGYVHCGGGGLLEPADFDGMSSLLVTRARTGGDYSRGSRAVQREALHRLIDEQKGNPIVRKTLTCLHREIDSSMPNMTQPSDSESDDDTERPEGRLAHPNAFIGAATTSLPLDPTAHNQSLTRDPSLGDKRLRDGALVSQPLDTDTPESSAGNATHTVLLPKGAGDRVDSEGACSRKHYRRKMFASIADTFGRAEEFIWFHFQLMTKRSMQGGGTSTVNAHLAMNASSDDVNAHSAALHRRWKDLREAAPEYVPYCNVFESYTSTVGANVVGSKAYWDEAAAELHAMAVEHGPPQYWATFTCNESGWSDLKAACDGEHHSKRPVEATRQYNRRWDAFLKRYLTGQSPIGNITRVWWRQEDQMRASLHIHIVFWVAEAEDRDFDDTSPLPGDTAIIGTAPRACRTREERQWRKCVLRLQRHDCRPKCKVSMGVSCEECKYGYPRRYNVTRGASGCAINPTSGRYEYDCEYEEDTRISPYVAEWLLAWGASMNIQRCTGTGFMDYTSK